MKITFCTTETKRPVEHHPENQDKLRVFIAVLLVYSPEIVFSVSSSAYINLYFIRGAKCFCEHSIKSHKEAEMGTG